jgi:hypothetical protein
VTLMEYRRGRIPYVNFSLTYSWWNWEYRLRFEPARD